MNRQTLRISLLVCAAAILSPGGIGHAVAQAQPAAEATGGAAPVPIPVPEIGIVEKLGTMLPMDAEVYDERGYRVALKDVVKHPAVFTFVYFRCPSICSPLLTEVSRVAEKMDLEPNRDYQIVTLSFDHREKPELAAQKKESYLNAMKRKIDPEGWRFLTADSVTIRRITDAAGFYFKQEGNDYIHAGALVVVSPEGKIARYINGIQYLPFDVKMAVMEAAEGRTGPTIARLIKLCYRYDPEAKTYTMNVTRVAGIVTVAVVAIYVLIFIVRPRKKKTAER